MAKAAYVGYQATRYDDTGRMLPVLIREAEESSTSAWTKKMAQAAQSWSAYRQAR